MAILTVKQDGSGTHTEIQAAIFDASPGDIVSIEAGTYQENLDVYKEVKLLGAGKELVTVDGIQETSVVRTYTCTLGSTTLTMAAGTEGLKKGRIISGTGIPTGTRIASISPNSITISAPTTANRTTPTNGTMAFLDATIRVRAVNVEINGMKVVGVQAQSTRAASDNGTIYLRSAGLGSVAASNYLIENCEITARGDSAVMSDNTGVGGGTMRGCIVNGVTYVGPEPAQVHAFSSLPLDCAILTSTTIELPSADYLVDVKVGSPILTVAGFTQSATTVSAISGTVLTLNKALLSGVGETKTVTFTNIQFNIPNVARQLVVFQPNLSAPVVFQQNTIQGITGAGISYNTAVTIDAPGSTVIDNTFEGEFGQGYALRVRSLGATVENNSNNSMSPNQNSGYYFFLDGATVQTGMNIGTNTSLTANLVEIQQNGQTLSVSMDKDLVSGLAAVQASPTFSNESNWKLVGYIFKHDSSAKRVSCGFQDFETGKSVALKATMQSGETYQLHKLIVSTPSRELLVIPRADIDGASGYDFTLS